MESIFRVSNEKPNQLHEILNEFEKTCNTKDLEEIFRYFNDYHNEGFGGNKSIIHDYQINLDQGRPNFYKSYLRYMSLCFYYCRKDQISAAWYYFSRAEYFKGVYDAWDKVTEKNKIIELLKKENSNEVKELSALDLIISKALQNIILSSDKKSKSAWTDKSSFIAAVNLDVHEIMNKHKKSRSKSKPITDGVVKKMIYRLLREDNKLNELFIQSLE